MAVTVGEARKRGASAWDLGEYFRRGSLSVEGFDGWKTIGGMTDEVPSGGGADGTELEENDAEVRMESGGASGEKGASGEAKDVEKSSCDDVKGGKKDGDEKGGGGGNDAGGGGGNIFQNERLKDRRDQFKSKGKTADAQADMAAVAKQKREEQLEKIRKLEKVKNNLSLNLNRVPKINRFPRMIF